VRMRSEYHAHVVRSGSKKQMPLYIIVRQHTL
jgi:hypothetical protein